MAQDGAVTPQYAPAASAKAIDDRETYETLNALGNDDLPFESDQVTQRRLTGENSNDTTYTTLYGS